MTSSNRQPSHLTPTQFADEFYRYHSKRQDLEGLFRRCHDQAIEMAAQAAKDFASETPPESSDWRNGERFAAGRIESRIFSLKGKRP